MRGIFSRFVTADELMMMLMVIKVMTMMMMKVSMYFEKQ